jgi:endogenous inhibitor of DNA gyrase (YacG/DUF329 family)
MASAPADNTARAVAPCPICNKPQTAEYRPFCSKRCADVDLSRWLHGVYAIPAKPDWEEDETPGDDAALREDSASEMKRE